MPITGIKLDDMPLMLKHILFFILLPLLFAANVFAFDKADSLKQKLNIISYRVDSLQKKLEYSSDSSKGKIYTTIALQYLKADTNRDKKTHDRYLESALNNTMKALHFYSKYNDSTGLRLCFDQLAFIYHKQQKFAQAKWFILQSNTLSRERNDVLQIISSLLVLADIKRDIGDYSLAKRDLYEALTLSAKNRLPEQASQVQLQLAGLYSKLNEPLKSALAFNRHLKIDDSLNKARLKLLAIQMHKEALLAAAKKKVFLTGNSRQIVSGSSKTTGSLAYLSFSSF